MIVDNSLEGYFTRYEILCADYPAHGETCKAELIKKHGIHIHIDDHMPYWAAAAPECISLLVGPDASKPYYEKDWKADAAGEFGRACSKPVTELLR